MSSPFDSAKYEALLEGLEITVMPLSQLEETFRMDGEYYRKYLISLEKALMSKEAQHLSDVCTLVSGPFGSEFIVDNYTEESAYRYVRGKDVKRFFLEQGDNVYIPAQDFERMSGFCLEVNDVLLSVVGTLGCAAVVTKDDLPSVFSCKSTVLRCHECDPYYLTAYINSRVGQRLLLRRARGAVQMGLNLSDLRSFVVPRFSDGLVRYVSSNIKACEAIIIEGRSAMERAERLLLESLGLADWQPPTPLTYTRRASDAFRAARLDAEHFHPKFDDLVNTVEKNGVRLVKLGKIIRPIMNGFDAREFVDDGTPYIRVGDVGEYRIKNESAMQVDLQSSEIGKDITLRVGDVLYTRKGSFGNAAPVREGQENSIISSEIMLIRIRDEWKEHVLPEYLSVFFQSIFGVYQSEKWAHGAAFYSVSQRDLNGFVVPILPIHEQRRIKESMNSSEMLRRKAQSLLDRAKRAVEIAIEQSEVAAMRYLEEAND